MPEYSVLNKGYPRVDAVDKVTGRTQYTSDVYLPGMLACKVLQSTKRHARILSVDTSRVEQLSGVFGVVTGRDLPDVLLAVGSLRDKRLFALDKVRYLGEPLAAVAAVDEMTAQEALDLIQVEYEEMEAVTNAVEAMKPSAPLVHEDMESYEGSQFALGGNICAALDGERGDVDKAFQEADYVIEDTFRTQAIHQGYLEPMACIASVDPSGRINVWTSTQGPYPVRATLAEVLQCPVSRIRVVPMEMGGGFGAKLRVCLEIYPVVLSMKTGRPVKMVASREESFTLSGFRLPTVVHLKTGVMKDGTMVAREATSIFDTGAYTGPGVQSGISHSMGAYRIPNARLRSYGVYTNKIGAGSYRASGVADVVFAVESHTDIIAHKLGMDPMEFRLKNLLEEGDVSIRGDKIPQNGLKETLQVVRERLGMLGSSEEGHGVGISVGEWRSGSGPSSANVTVNEDGTLTVLTGSVDISGSDTSLAQIAAETLGVEMDQVVMPKRDTDMAPFTGASGGSRIVYSQGKAVQLAAEDARDKLLALAAERLGTNVDALRCAGGRIYVEDNPEQGHTLANLARMSFTSPTGPIMGMASLSTLPFAPVFNTQAAQVRVDTETGQIRVTRFIQGQDVGTAINPMSVEGQMEGGAIQAVGRAVTENVVFDQGKIMNPSLTTYLMPLAMDTPPIENILVQVPSDDGPFGARAVAEPPGFGAPAAIANAIYNAVGVRIKDLPLTEEKIMAALRGEAPKEENLDLSFLEGHSDAGSIQWAGSG